ncbi:MexH family multidrug efflux RND transporter periplasmic adaptor subunit [Devosia pacifica]|uniref:MexH family multidrug efflux RND transporter periplasmic adaptor subunit n=1 Tax=Devosia pacifica TaxID=1335967 RepID=A0A918S0F2_9HYPH|nr:efflux RND transporter periplasmic adaptor subunit [Devosia pacifica]GHA17807.1 MexH family multidrug efflux RND transporter periplasmic adaptor subunit [Devosia pacifica]
MLRQLSICLVLSALAFVGWVNFAPGARQTLDEYGISVPFLSESAQAAEGGPARGGGPSGGFGGWQTNVVTTPVTLATINDSLTALGESAAARSVTVTSPAGGTLEELLVAPGDVVEAGQIIGRLNSAAQSLARDRAALALQNAEATLERQQELARSNLVASSALSTAQLDADTAELELRSAELELEERQIVSPIAGTVGLMQVTPGNYVGSQTAITTIEDTSSLRVNFWVPERYATIVRTGMQIDAMPVALPGEVFSGEISAIDNRVETESRTLQVQATIPNDDGAMRPGMSFSVSMAFDGQQFPAVDPLAILWSAEGSYVWKYSDGRAERVMAEIVQRNSDGVLVRAELQQGDPIITEGILQLGDGDEVNLLSGPDGNQNAEAEPADAPVEQEEG